MLREEACRTPGFEGQAGERGRLPSRNENYFGWGTMRR
jgi:hypothetical protein